MTVNPEHGGQNDLKFGSTGFFRTRNRLVTFSTTSDQQEGQILDQGCQILKIFLFQRSWCVKLSFQIDFFFFLQFQYTGCPILSDTPSTGQTRRPHRQRVLKLISVQFDITYYRFLILTLLFSQLHDLNYVNMYALLANGMNTNLLRHPLSYR